jgi:hypothetical protein
MPILRKCISRKMPNDGDGSEKLFLAIKTKLS